MNQLPAWRAMGRRGCQVRPFRALAIVLMLLASPSAFGQTATAAPPAGSTFRAGVDRVMISAVVRDGTGAARDRPGPDGFRGARQRRTAPDHRLPRRPRARSAWRSCSTAAAACRWPRRSSRPGSQRGRSWPGCEAGRDELAIYSFDTALHQLEPFALYREDATLERSLFGMTPFGMTSLNDAIAATAKDVATRPNSHRAVIVLTDGRDNHSQLSPAEASVIASSIDVPVYIMAVVSPLDHAGRRRP